VTDDLLLTLEDVAVGYGRQVVLRGLNFGLKRGSFTGLLGANGSGKSTLIKTLLGILPALAGRIVYAPRNGRPPVLGYVPQRETLDPVFLISCFEMVLMGACGRVGPGRFLTRAEKERARRCLRETGAEDLARRRFSELSGGQKQRVLIARALATEPDFLLLDEPTAGLDTGATQAILELLTRLNAGRGMTLLMVSHDLPVLRLHVREVIWLRQGSVLQGSVEELLRRETMERMMELGWSP
jgi:ABC-type Mn2+/Zn2+ transport system ATPase subunit